MLNFVRNSRVRPPAVAASVLLAALALACGKTTDATPRDVAMQFYVTLEAAGVRGVPESRALPALEPYVSAELSAMLGQAAETAATANTTDLDTQRSVFSGYFEGYSTYHVRETRMNGDTALVIMAFTNASQKPAVAWTDTLVVVKGAPAWRIADVRYGGGWEFGFRGSLRDVLTRAASSTPLGETSATPPAPAANTR